MESFYGTPFSKALLTAVFAGIGTTLICLFFNVIFREETGFLPSDLINVSSLIFITNLIFLVMGTVYALLRNASPGRGELIYIVFFALLTLFTVLQTIHVHRSGIAAENTQFRELLTSLVLIIGVIGAFGVPFLFHNKKFEDAVI